MDSPRSPSSPPRRVRAAAAAAASIPDSPRTKSRKMSHEMQEQYTRRNDQIGREMRLAMDELVLGCALDQSKCAAAIPMLKHHATAYAARFGNRYALPPTQMYMLHDEPNPVLRAAQLATAHQMINVANDAIDVKMKQVNVSGMGRSVMSKMLEQMQHSGQSRSFNPHLRCDCDPMAPTRNPSCKVKPELCKHHARHLHIKFNKKEGGAKSKTKRNKRRNNKSSKPRRS